MKKIVLEKAMESKAGERLLDVICGLGRSDQR